MEALQRILTKLVAVISLAAVIFTVGAILVDVVFGAIPVVDSYGQPRKFPIFSYNAIGYLASLFSVAMSENGLMIVADHLSQSPFARSLLARVLPLCLLSIVVSVAVLWRKRPLLDPAMQSGVALLKGQQAIEFAKQSFKQKSKRQGHEAATTIYLAPHIPITIDQETTGTFLEGGVGSGKTTIIRYLMDQVIDRGDKVIIYDVKGDFAPFVKDRLVLNPFAEGSVSWDIASDVRTDEQAQQLAAMLIPKPVQGDTFWSSSAQIVMTGIFVTLQHTQPGRWTFLDVYKLLMLPLKDLLSLLQTHYPPATKIVQGSGGNMEVGIVATLVSQVMPFVKPLAQAWGTPGATDKRVSLRAWLLTPTAAPNTIILQGSPEHQDAAATWIRMAINFMAGVVLSAELKDYGPQRIWFFIDEMPSLGTITRLTEVVDRGRSKGVRTVLACQNLYQLEPLYGDWAKAADANFGIRIYGRMQPSQRSKDICSFVGEQIYEVVKENVTLSSNGRSVTNRLEQYRKQVLTPEILMSLGSKPSGGIDAIVLGFGAHALQVNWPFPKKQKPFHQGFRPAVFNRSALTNGGAEQTKAKSSVAKVVRAKLDTAINDFDAAESQAPKHQ
jgi:hypothetical protein